MAFLGMTAHPLPDRTAGPVRSTVEVLAPTGGFFRSSIALHGEVQAGDLLGTITDIYGSVVDEILAPKSGAVWACRETPAVRPGELIAMIALAPSG